MENLREMLGEAGLDIDDLPFDPALIETFDLSDDEPVFGLSDGTAWLLLGSEWIVGVYTPPGETVRLPCCKPQTIH